MTAKRFTTSLDKWFVIDKLIDKDYCLGNNKDTDNLVECLNNLHEEIMDLRRENIKFKLTVSEIIEDMQKYVDDNQLIYINQSYVDWIKKEVDTTLYSQKKELKE